MLVWAARVATTAGAERMEADGRPADRSWALMVAGVMPAAAVAAWAELSMAMDTSTTTAAAVARRAVAALAETVTCSRAG